MTTDAIITFENVGVVLGEDPIYDRLSFDVRRGEFVCILGPSGCGKSTSLRIIGGLLDASSGRVTVDGRDPHDAWPEIAFVFQSPRLVPWRTALDNVLLGSELRFGAGDRERRRARASELLRLVGLAGDTDKYPSMLSGGERQRVAIARAIVGQRSLLLADEPTGALDSVNGEAVMKLLRSACKRGLAGVIVTHDAQLAAWADRVVFVRDGRIVDQTSARVGPESLLPTESHT
jgi:NitT/TauT family transport system ATP-binding protein